MHPLVLHVPIGAMIFLALLFAFQKPLGLEHSKNVIYLGLVLTSLSASLAALFGLFLSLQSDYGTDALARHKIGGILLSCLCYGALLWYNTDRKKSVFLGIGVLSIITLVFTGHTGAVLTHGDNFLWAPISKPDVVLTAENSSLYHFAVEPILEKKCFTCHNETKAKGNLIMTSPEKFQEGGENGIPWVAGDPSESRMIKAFYLPLSDDKHMPPDGKPQLNTMEIDILKAWIKSGADFNKKLDQFEDGDSLRLLIASLAAVQEVAPVEEVYTFKAVSSKLVDDLNTPFRTIFPLYQNSPALQADFFVRKAFEEKALEELTAVDDQLVVLNLSKMPVSDKHMSTIKSFVNLERLNLNFTGVHGEGLQELKSLTNLRSISLAGTAIEARHLDPVLNLPQLEDVFVWSTHITDAQRDSLSDLYPDVSIVTSQFKDESILTLSTPLLENEGIIKRGEEVVLKHPMPGVTIRYTLDGAAPDTLSGSIFEKPFPLDETTVIKTTACKDSWYCSKVIQFTCFVEGIKPTAVKLLSVPDPKYPGEGAKSLTDGRKGLIDVLKEPSWLGYRSHPLEAGITFESKPNLSKIVLSFGRSIGAHCFPPEEVEVWAGEDSLQLKLIKKVRGTQPDGYQPLSVDALTIPLEGTAYGYYKVVVKPVAKLPDWHSGKGEKAWIFIDELFFY
jgi:uncharacterized membrane protein